jgi:hypothetical protein
MEPLTVRIRTRLAPALLTAAGVTLVAAGLLSYTAPVDALPPSDPPPTSVALDPTPSPSPPPSTPASSSPPASPSESASPTPRPSRTPDPAKRVATRVAVPALGIDLPVVRPPRNPKAYPWCDVAMYIKELGQPGQNRATYLYGHAREGMFLPILEASMRNDGRRMLGMLVMLWTSDDQLFLYEISEVRRHQYDLDDAANAKTEQLWLQTSEGPPGTIPKTQVIARPLSVGPANHADAHPKARPVDC